MFQLYDYQSDIIHGVRASINAGHNSPLVVSPTGSGKCLARGTEVMLYNGRVEPVERIREGDLLMGPDSRPRKVVSLARGREQMYRVTPVKGEPYVVNESHILSLKMTPGNAIGYRAGEVVNISVLDYLAQTKTFRHCAKGWKAAVDFSVTNEPLRIPAYMMGAWLGDGSSRHFSITTEDPEMALEFSAYCDSIGFALRAEKNSENSINMHAVGGPVGYTGCVGGPLNNALKAYGVYMNKHVPHRYKTGTREERLDLLAGVMDTDGHNSGMGYDLTLKSERLIDDVIFVARSLGFSAYKKKCRKTCTNNGKTGTYYRCAINGAVDQIPCRIERKKAGKRRINKDPLVTGIRSVEPIGVDDYFGFEVDGPDRLFLLGDFTVTHNTVMFAWLAHRLMQNRRRVCILNHRQEISRQIGRALTKMGVPHGTIAGGSSGYDPRYAVHNASAMTVIRRIHTLQVPDIVINDEGHHATEGSTWWKILEYWRKWNPKLITIGFTATPERLDGSGLDGTYDDMVLGPSTADLMDMGYLANYKMYAPKQTLDTTGLRRRYGDFAKGDAEALVDRPTITGNAIAHYRQHLDGKPSIGFCVSVAHAEHTAEQFRQAGYTSVSIDGKMDKAERMRITKDFEEGRIHVLTSCELISEGYDVPGAHGAILLRPTESLALFLQQVGRALRVDEGKPYAVILDHAGNSARHGLPDSPREWSLHGEKRSRRKGDDEPDIPIRMCLECGAVNPASLTHCRDCGKEFPIKSRKVEEVEGELEEVDAAAEAFKMRQERAAARTTEDLAKVADKQGYSAGWAGHVQAAREAAKLPPTPEQEAAADKLRRIRHVAGVTNEELAEKLSIPRFTAKVIQRIVTKRKPTDLQMQAINDWLESVRDKYPRFYAAVQGEPPSPAGWDDHVTEAREQKRRMA